LLLSLPLSSGFEDGEAFSIQKCNDCTRCWVQLNGRNPPIIYGHNQEVASSTGDPCSNSA
jgi:hypothetical protein